MEGNSSLCVAHADAGPAGQLWADNSPHSYT